MQCPDTSEIDQETTINLNPTFTYSTFHFINNEAKIFINCITDEILVENRIEYSEKGNQHNAFLGKH